MLFYFVISSGLGTNGGQMMTNKENQGKKIYDKASKKWYAVSNEFYKAYDRMCNTTRKYAVPKAVLLTER